jgi:hypothetical protein
MDGMMDICRGKLGWTSSSRLLQVRILFGMKPRDSSSTNTSGVGNRVNRMTSIKLGENGVLLSSREGSHDSNG